MTKTKNEAVQKRIDDAVRRVAERIQGRITKEPKAPRRPRRRRGVLEFFTGGRTAT